MSNNGHTIRKISKNVLHLNRVFSNRNLYGCLTEVKKNLFHNFLLDGGKGAIHTMLLSVHQVSLIIHQKLKGKGVTEYPYGSLSVHLVSLSVHKSKVSKRWKFVFLPLFFLLLRIFVIDYSRQNISKQFCVRF